MKTIKEQMKKKHIICLLAVVGFSACEAANEWATVCQISPFERVVQRGQLVCVEVYDYGWRPTACNNKSQFTGDAIPTEQLLAFCGDGE